MTHSELEQVTVFETATLREAMLSLKRSGRGLVVVLGEGEKVVGVLSDGDIRMALLVSENLNLPVSACLSRDFVYVHEGARQEELLTLLDVRIRAIPILDSKGHLVDLVGSGYLDPERAATAKAFTILGTGVFALELHALLVSQGQLVNGFVGPEPKFMLPKPWIGEDSKIPTLSSDAIFLVAIGKPGHRERVGNHVQSLGRRLGQFIHSSAWIAEDVKLSDGCIVYPNATIHAGASLGRGVLVNSNATIGHNTKLGEFSNVGPGASIGGCCNLAKGIYLGIGATLIDSIRISEGVLVGAGGVVVQDISESGTYVGVPARRLSS